MPAPTGAMFEAHRDHLMGVAYRMLGSRSDAEDAVQEAWLRWAAADQPDVRDVRAWLTTVTARICLNQLRSARGRREAYVGHWLPEPLVERLPPAAPDPAEWAVQAEEVSYALLVVLERLTPEQRVAFVLHDVFSVPFDEVAAALSITPVAARQLASRGRRAVTAAGDPRHTAGLAEQHRVLTAFFAAARSGDLAGLVAVLAPDAEAIGDGGGVVPAARQPVVGAAQVARFLATLFARYGQPPGLQVEPVLVNGALGMLAEMVLPEGQRVRATMAFAIADGRVTGVYSQLNPAKLARVPALRAGPGWTLPGWLAAAGPTRRTG